MSLGAKRRVNVNQLKIFTKYIDKKIHKIEIEI